MTALAEPVTEVLPLRMDENGVLKVGRTRVTLDTVVAAWEQGATAEQIAQDYDTLTLGDVYAVIGYYLNHRSEVDAYLEQRRLFRDEMRRRVEAPSPSREFRERLLARSRARE